MAKTLQGAGIRAAQGKRTAEFLLYLRGAGYCLKDPETLSLQQLNTKTKNKCLKLRQKTELQHSATVLLYAKISTYSNFYPSPVMCAHEKIVQAHVTCEEEPPLREREYIFTFFF